MNTKNMQIIDISHSNAIAMVFLSATLDVMTWRLDGNFSVGQFC